MWVYILACIACGILWRMGGADGYDKLWRRIGCSFIIFAMLLIHSNMNLLESVISLAMIVWGCWSYFGWLNFWTSREYWYNFFAGAILIQSSILIESFSLENLCTAFVFALLGAFGKVWIDKDEDGYKTILFWRVREDVLSEWYFGAVMCAGIIINCTL